MTRCSEKVDAIGRLADGMAMPRFYFDLRDGEEFTPDEEGVELDDLEAAKTEATEALAQLAKDVLPGAERREIAVEVRDEAKLPLLRAALRFEVWRNNLSLV
jgi:hypothetical protein